MSNVTSLLGKIKNYALQGTVLWYNAGYRRVFPQNILFKVASFWNKFGKKSVLDSDYSRFAVCTLRASELHQNKLDYKRSPQNFPNFKINYATYLHL